jgi:hypothetical protein
VTRRVLTRLSAAVATAVALAGCGDGDDASDTLAPLPIPGPTVPGDSVLAAPPGSATVSTAVAPTVAIDAPLLVGDWDGAAFDVGVIDRVGELGGYRTIEFDRYSYRDPKAGVIDAEAFEAEPIAYGWTESPFVNIQEQLRTFVLAEDVEVLVLGGRAAGRRCRDDGAPPPATWLNVSPSHLDLPAATEEIASLTYSDEGQVERIRFTHGCR